ncbi:MAG TPA: AAA family ATPase [Thermaerobacter sp.]
MCWHRLRLHGFGPFRDAVEFRFPDGLSHWVAPNESGKSSLVAGLVAVLFGLPGSSDPSRYGQARYRHWGGVSRFEGELEFTAIDGRRYRLQRDFGTHRVRLLRLDPRGPVEEWAGTHNPAANRPAPGYEEAIRRLVGIGSRAVLLETFCLQQPLPVPEAADRQPGLAPEVQQLLAGAGARSPAQALAALVEAIKALTRWTRELGVSAQNLRQDREMEQVEQRIHQLEDAIARDREAADQLERVRRRLAELAAHRQALDQRLQRCRARHGAWVEWRRRVERYRDRLVQRRRMEQAAQRAAELEAEIAALRQEERRRWPGWEAWAGDDESGPAAALDRLLQVSQAAAALRDQLAMLSRRRRQAAARVLLAAWCRYRFLDRALAALDRLGQRAPRLAAASADDLERLRSAPRREAELQRQAAALAGELRARERALQAVEEEARELAAAYADVQPWTPEIAAAAAEMAALQEEAQRRQEEAARRRAEAQQRRRVARRVALSVGAAAAVAAAALGRALGAPVWLLPLATGLASLVAGWVAWRWVGGAMGTDATADEGLRQRMEAVRARLGPWGDEAPSRLRELEGRFREWQARRKALEERRLREAADRDDVRRRLEAVKAEIEGLRRWVAPFVGGTGDADRVAAWWDAVCRLRRRLEEERVRLAGDLWGTRSEEVPSLDEVARLPLAGSGRPWHAMARVLAADLGEQGQPVATAGEPEGTGGIESPGSWTVGHVVEWLQRWDAAFWDEPDAEAGRWSQFEERQAEWCRALEASWAAGADPEPSALPDWPPAVYEHLQRLEVEQAQEVAAATRRADAVAGELESLRAEEAALRARWRDLLDACGGDPAQARERWQAYAAHRQRRREREGELKGVLAGWEAPDADALAVRLEQWRDACLVELRAIEDLANRFPELPTGEDLDPAQAGNALAGLEEEMRGIEAELRQADEELRRLAAQEAAYLQRAPVNIAQAELELHALRARRQALQDELDALVLAHRHLREALVEFHATYRQRLEDAASRYFARITGRSGRRVVLDPQFRLSVREADGTPVVAEQLSQGTRDQLFWALRVAVADLLAGDVNLPFVLDDPFVHWDDRRLEEARRIVTALAQDRQVVILSHRPALASWGEPVGLAGAMPPAVQEVAVASTPSAPGGPTDPAGGAVTRQEEGEGT